MIKKLNLLLQQDLEFLHSPFMAEPIRDGDTVRAEIQCNDQEMTWLPVRVWRYSPFGMEVVNTNELHLKKGDRVSVKVILGNEAEVFNGLTISFVKDEGDKVLAGIRTFIPSRGMSAGIDRRENQRWLCPNSFLPTGTAPNPVRYNDHILFRVENISAGGLRLITSLRNKLVGKGQRLDATISLPMVGSVRALLLIKHIDTKEVDGQEFLLLGTQFVLPENILRSCLAEYLLNFCDGVTVQSLKDEQFPVNHMSKWLDFTYVKTESEYKSVLALRLLSYKSAGKLPGDAVEQDMADEYDSRARILIVKFKGKIVGSVRLMFHGQTDKTDHGRYIDYPSDFPSSDQIVEASRLCTDPAFRGSDITFELLAHMLLLTVKSGRRYIYSGASGTLLSFYKKCGWQLSGKKYRNEALGGLEHELMLMDTYSVALGKNIGPKYWSRLYRNLTDYLISNGLIVPTPADNLRLAIYRAAGGLFK